ncbi:MAG: hypothetical protein FWE56_03525 [Candidatus Bathyarchaeota archaeon]|nr:hypothetical protein [Candidatus Termiticorpusculum sp.]
MSAFTDKILKKLDSPFVKALLMPVGGLDGVLEKVTAGFDKFFYNDIDIDTVQTELNHKIGELAEKFLHNVNVIVEIHEDGDGERELAIFLTQKKTVKMLECD